MTARLVVLNVGGVALLLGLTLGFLYRYLQEHLLTDDIELFARQEVILSRWLADAQGNGALTGREVPALTSMLSSLGAVQIRLLDAHGNAIIDIATGPAVRDFPPLGSPPQIVREPGSPWRIVGTSEVRSLDGRASGVLQLVWGIEDDAYLLRNVRRWMLSLYAVALVGAAVLALVLARAVLRPLRQFEETVARVQPTQLDTRITPAHWPRELSGLAGELDRMLSRLEEAFRRLATFSADLSHELRTPINNLRGEAEVALRQTRTPEEYQRILESSLEETARIGRLIDLLLFLAKAEHQVDRISFHLLDAAAECRVVAEYFEPIVGERGITMAVSGDGTVRSNGELLRRAVSNLVDNAVKHTPSGGSIAITVRTAADRAVEIEVRDNGAGIPPADLPRVFDRFFRGTNATRARSSGFGLGLPIVRSILDAHGGTVSITSQPAHGTAVTLRFPPPDREPPTVT